MAVTSKKISLTEAVSMAVGTMIGASIFSIFGVGAQIARQNLPEAFIISGLFAFIVGFSYAKMGSKIVSNAGPIAFILRGIGDNVITGTLSILMWLSYVVSISLFAKGFTGYFLPFVHVTATPLTTGLTQLTVIAFFTALNFFGSKAVGRAEFYIVFVKLSILGVFILVGFLTVRPELIKPSFDQAHLSGTLYAAVMFFLSYMGFGLVTNASENMVDPEKNVPRAIYISIIIVIFVYVSVAIVAVGNLPLPELIKASDNALAVAARPFLGNFGFVLISLGALFSISSALNATLYGGANVSYSLAKQGELPRIFERKVWFNSPEGLYITAILGLLFALLFNIGGIASITSAVFLSIYLFVIISHFKLIKLVGGNRWVVLVNFFIIFAVFLTLLYYQWKSQRTVFWGTLITFSAAFGTELVYRSVSKRGFSGLHWRHKGSNKQRQR